MILELGLQNFKCFEDQSLPLGTLTLLAGLNGTGKSSVIQSFLVLRQSYLSGALQEGRLAPAGDLIDLGTVKDVWFDGAKDETIAIALRYGHLPSDQATFSFGVDKLTNTAKATDSKANDRALVRSRSDNSGGLFRPYADEGEDSPKNPFGRFHYLQAERHGPRKFLPMANERAAGVTLGTRGEFVLHFLHLYQDSILLADLDFRKRAGASERLRDQLEVWLGEISPGVNLAITPLPDADLMIGGYSFGAPGQLRSRNYRATNVGFGLSYILPVLVALLLGRYKPI